MRFLLRDARLAFPAIWATYKGSYGGKFIIPTDHKQLRDLKMAMLDVAKEKWEGKGPAIYKALEAADKLCLHNGDIKSQFEGFEGNLFVSANSKTKPTAFDLQRNDLTEADGKIYSGCYVNASLEIWAQDSSDNGKRINAQLRGVQFLRNGDAFAGGKPADKDDFTDEIGVDESEVDLTA